MFCLMFYLIIWWAKTYSWPSLLLYSWGSQGSGSERPHDFSFLWSLDWSHLKLHKPQRHRAGSDLFPLLLDSDMNKLRASTFESIFYFFLLQCVLDIAFRDLIIWTINSLRDRLAGDKNCDFNSIQVTFGSNTCAQCWGYREELNTSSTFKELVLLTERW